MNDDDFWAGCLMGIVFGICLVLGFLWVLSHVVIK